MKIIKENIKNFDGSGSINTPDVTTVIDPVTADAINQDQNSRERMEKATKDLKAVIDGAPKAEKPEGIEEVKATLDESLFEDLSAETDLDTYLKQMAEDDYESGQVLDIDDFDSFRRGMKEDGFDVTEADFNKYFEYFEECNDDEDYEDDAEDDEYDDEYFDESLTEDTSDITKAKAQELADALGFNFEEI